jgi:hypothetical protein
MMVARQYDLQTKLWIGVLVTNGTVTNQIDYIIDNGGPTIELHFKDTFPIGTSIANWAAVSSPKTFLYEMQASLDEVTFQVVLHTDGTAEFHRLLATIVRACLKRARETLDGLGYQELVIAQSPLLPVNDPEPEIQTQFTVRGKFLEHWIANEVELPDPNANIRLFLQVHSDGEVQGVPNQDVELGEIT